MSTINISFKDDYAVMEFNRPKANAINEPMVHEMREAFAKLASSESVQGVILTGQGTIFSAGLDVVELYGYDETEIDNFWQSFQRLLLDMAGFPKPLVAAINGHAPAGGCVFALCCDCRIMANGKGRIGLNEVPVGIVLPTPIVELARHAVGETRAAEMILHGALLLPQEAGAFGLIHAVVAPDKLIEAAEAKLASWLELPQAPWREAKVTLRRPLLEAMDVEFSDGYGATLREWWSVDSRARLGTMIDKLKKK